MRHTIRRFAAPSAHSSRSIARTNCSINGGEALGPDVSILKLAATAAHQKMTELALETSAEQGVPRGDGICGNAQPDALSAFFLPFATFTDLRPLKRRAKKHIGE
ncbi:MAG: hypothetical protein ACLQIQ_14230 [Beijerinckiaceae bacterium]